jgi:hypothetical protein
LIQRWVESPTGLSLVCSAKQQNRARSPSCCVAAALLLAKIAGARLPIRCVGAEEGFREGVLLRLAGSDVVPLDPPPETSAGSSDWSTQCRCPRRTWPVGRGPETIASSSRTRRRLGSDISAINHDKECESGGCQPAHSTGNPGSDLQSFLAVEATQLLVVHRRMIGLRLELERSHSVVTF